MSSEIVKQEINEDEFDHNIQDWMSNNALDLEDSELEELYSMFGFTHHPDSECLDCGTNLRWIVADNRWSDDADDYCLESPDAKHHPDE